MRLLVLSDIHGNWPALQAIQEDVDALVCLGDIVSYGPFPRECIAWIQERAVHVLRGNHDTALAFREDPRAAGFKRELAQATLEVHRRILSADAMGWMQSLPTQARFRFDDYDFQGFHASPADPLFDYRLTPQLSDEELKNEVQGVQADVLCVGHTHLPMVRRPGPMLVLNPGSVGQPLDGDPRASYAVVQDGVAEIRRVSYDIEATIAGIRRMGLSSEAADALIRILRTGLPRSFPRDRGNSSG